MQVHAHHSAGSSSSSVLQLEVLLEQHHQHCQLQLQPHAAEFVEGLAVWLRGIAGMARAVPRLLQHLHLQVMAAAGPACGVPASNQLYCCCHKFACLMRVHAQHEQCSMCRRCTACTCTSTSTCSLQNARNTMQLLPIHCTNPSFAVLLCLLQFLTAAAVHGVFT